MPTEDNSKTPDEVEEDALDEQKAPPQEGQIVKDFVKSSAAAKQIIDALPENTAKQQVFKAILWTVISLSATLAVPLGSLAYSYGQERAKRKSETQKKKAEAENVRRKLQLDLLKQIIDVAKNAEFKDPKSVYRLGLIAAMVNENHAAFGIKLINAEQTMKSMSDRLAPIAGLRRRLTESGILLADLQSRYKEAKKEEDILNKRIKEINEIFKITKHMGTWRKKKLEKELGEKENELDHQKVQRRFYQEREVAEQKVRMYFTAELKRQEKILQDALRQTATLRDTLKRKSVEVARLATTLEQESKSAKETVKKFKVALVEMQKEHGQAIQTVKRLRAELDSERLANDNMKKLVQAYSKYLEQCKAQIKVTSPKADTGAGSGARKIYQPPVKKRTMKYQRTPMVARRATTIRRATPVMKAMRRYFKGRRALDGLFKK